MVKIGTKFKASIADGNPEWKVIERVAADAWKAEVIDDPDYKGSTRLFSSSEIERSKGLDDLWAKEHNEHKKFYDSLNPGQIVHYNDFRKSFIRCEVVKKGKENVLRPIAMCGEWHFSDLPRRWPNGIATDCRNARMIRSGETFTPNYTNIVESPKYAYSKDHTPKEVAALPSIDLSVPPPTEQQRLNLKALDLFKAIQYAAEKWHRDICDNPTVLTEKDVKKLESILTLLDK